MVRKITMIFLVLVLMQFSFALTDTYTTIRFEVTSSTSMSVSYQSPCTQSSFACRWNGGTMTEINITANDGSECQNGADYALRITNDGTIPIDVAMNLNESTSGVTLKYSTGSYDYAGASTITTTSADTTTSLGVSSDADYWFWCDFSNFNSGASGYVDSLLFHNATAS
ncbi:hypothetical protein C0585_04940 [Candidatus Woesearchaeota archaeon]|nr:MAG: hypothetical protein C0585_04940 [Candidatus Woesearchaeota archaeon]